MKRAAVVKKSRRIAREALEAVGVADMPWERAVVSAGFWHSHKRRRDSWNYAAWLKSYIDGVIDAGLLADDDSEHLEAGPVTFAIDRDCPRVELTFTRK